MTRSLHTLIHYLHQSISHRGDPALTDAQLLERWIEQHDPAAFELMLWRHGPMVLNTCRRLLRRSEDVEDAFQGTFLVLVRKAGSIRSREALAAWLHRIACRVAGRAREANVRRNKRELSFAAVPPAPYVDASSESELSAILDEEIESLPAHYRRALILCCLEGKSQEEAARLLNRPRGTVSSWLTRGRERLRRRLLRRGIVVSTAGLTAALTPDALSAGGVIPLVGSLVRMAGAVGAGGSVPGGLISARSILLAEGVLRMMFLTKLKIAAAISLVVAVTAAGVGTGIGSRSTSAAEDPPMPQQAAPNPQINVQNNWGQPLGQFNDPKLVLAPNGHEQDGIAWGEKMHGLQAGIAFRRGDQERYEVGQSVTFVVYLRNVSDKKIDLSHIEPLFDERMPDVADADGRHLAVATGPIRLGRVPILHRSLEAGQRITLGYPWFRIRPLGWCGNVQGPTCCAEPGRYTIGYTSLPLQLNDGRDISVGTKRVELSISKCETAKEDDTDKRVPTVREPLISGVGDAEERRLFFFRVRSVEIPFTMNAKHQQRTKELTLLVSRDGGQTWEQVDRKLSTERSFHYKAPEDGMYWLIVQTVDDKGHRVPGDLRRAKPAFRVCVDTTPPVAEMYARQVNKTTIRLAWMAKDDNLGDTPIEFEWAEKKDGPWRRISTGPLPHSGNYDWQLPKRLPSKVYLRIHVRDKAGNDGYAIAYINLKEDD